MLYPIVNEERFIISLDGIWDFRFCDENAWNHVYVPASFNNQLVTPKARSYSGLVEYKTSFIIPTHLEDKRRVLRFDCVAHNARVFIDDVLLGANKGGFLPFEFDISAISCGIEHILRVEVDNRINHSTLPIGNEAGPAFFGSDNPGIPSVEHGKKRIEGQNMPNFDFFNYAGINRHVRVYTTPYDYIDDIVLVPSIDGNDGVIDYDIKVVGTGNFSLAILDKENNVVASSNNMKGSLRIKNAKLWNPYPDEPYLYKARICFGADVYEECLGIRSVEVRGNKLLINGKPFYFKGFGKHEDFFIRGKGIDECLNVKDIALLHWIGANSIRTSHYPYSEEMYRLCDREGIVVIDELPAVGMNFQGAMNPYRLGTREYHEKLLKKLIERDKNHPSVVMWSLGNEPDSEHYPKDAYDYWKNLYSLAHILDPANRPVTMVCCQNDYTKDIITREMDVVCINRYYGWYNLSGNLDVAKDALEEEMMFWKDIDRPLILTEYGADAISGMHSLVPEMFSEEFQCEYLKAMNSILDKFDFIIGEHPWCFADFDTQQGPMRAGGNHKGVFNRDRSPKMAAFYLRDRWQMIGNYAK